MIGLVLDKFESSSAFLNKISSKYDYILVDEYQDTNDNQNQIVFKLVATNENVFIVGDDDQIIYSFQGANLDTIGSFLKQFPDTKVICLEENMRSTQSILDVARIVAKQDNRRLEINPELAKFNINKDLIAKNEKVIALDKKVRLTMYQNKEEELIEIVSEIESLINSEDCPKDNNGNKIYNEIAIIATNNDDLAVFADMLKDKNIPFERKDGRSIFEIKSSITLFYFLQMLVNPELYSDKILKLLLLPPFEINPIDYAKIYKRITVDKTFIDSMRAINDWQEAEKIEKFIKLYDNLQTYITTESVRNIVMEVGSKTGIFDYFLNEETNQNENIAGLKKLVDEAREFSNAHNKITINDFVEYLIMVQNDKDMDIITDKPDVPINAVQLTTYHSSKGREYEYVYMPTLQSNRWESSTKSFKPTIPVSPSNYKTENEWRLYRLSDRVKTMYVGMTRARHTLRLSYLAQAGKKATSPSAWVMAATDLMEIVNSKEQTIENLVYQAKKALVKRSYDYRRDFVEQVNKKIDGRNYSPSAFNTYQACPRKFFYGDILKFDGRLSFADAANYGSAFHLACKYMVDEAMAKGKYPTKEEFYNKFKTTLDTLPISTFQQREILEGRGKKEVEEYYHHLTDTPIKNLFAVEYDFDIEYDGVKFRGIVDKITKNDDGTYSIIDYKTGTPCKSSDISPNGKHKDYYNQICLYKYYFEKKTGVVVRDLSFVFTVDCSVVTLTPTEEECESVVNELKQSIISIADCNFEPSYNKDACKYCNYKDFCRMEIV
jgi:DNA helicase-2/ATP-dependent DNA helicase PcrA